MRRQWTKGCSTHSEARNGGLGSFGPHMNVMSVYGTEDRVAKNPGRSRRDLDNGLAAAECCRTEDKDGGKGRMGRIVEPKAVARDETRSKG